MCFSLWSIFPKNVPRVNAHARDARVNARAHRNRNRNRRTKK